MKIIKIKIVKVQKRDGSALVTIPSRALKEIGSVEYLSCEVREEENGEKILVFRPVRI